MNHVLGIDPGTIKSGWILLKIDILKNEIFIINKYYSLNNDMNKIIFKLIISNPLITIVIEDIVSYGMSIGQTTIETAKWAARFYQKALDSGCKNIFYLSRPEVKLNLCLSRSAKDKNVKQVLKDRFGQFGTKKNPDKLYTLKTNLEKGMLNHVWSAFALSIAFININYDKKNEYKIE